MNPSTIDPEQFDQLILQRLPTLMQQNAQIQGLVLDLARQNFAERKETDDRFYQLLGELRRDREEQNRKWEEQNHKWEEQNHKWEEQNRKWGDAKQETDRLLGELRQDREEQNRKWQEYTQEQNRKWEEQNHKWKEYTHEQNHKWEGYIQEQNRKWEEQNRKWEDAKREFDRMHEAIMAIAKKHDRSVSALGARWGLKSEKAFRKALIGILEKNFDVQVMNITDYDDEGIVFGRPDQVELDVVIKNGFLIIGEIKSSMSRSDMYTFERKVRFYEKRHHCQVSRMLVISPMVDEKAKKIAKNLGIEIYGDSIEVKNL